MTLPTILFGILLSSAYGAAYHVFRGGSVRWLTFFLLLAWTGFWGGDLLGWQMRWTFASVGELNVGIGTLGAAIFLLAGDFLSRIRLSE
jgi:hypothetical protein